METYDPAQVGKRIAWGRSHSVYRYGETEIIKFPKLERWVWPKLRERIERDISVCQKYFGEYLLDTRIVQDKVSGQIATIQPYIVGHYLSKSDLADPELKRQFEDFLGRYDSMIRAGYGPVELIGQGGVLKRCLSNVMVLPDKKLRLYDAVIMDTAYMGRWAFAIRLLARYVLRRQASTIRFLLA